MELLDPTGPIELADGLLACAIADAGGVLRGFNAAFPKQLGFSAAHLNRRPLVQLFGEDLRPEVERVLAQVRNGIPCHVAWPTRLGSGKIIYCEWHLQPRVLRGGVPGGSEIAVVPVEVQRHEWRQLNDAHDRFRSIAAGVAAMVWVATEDGTIRASNRAWRDFLGGSYPSPDLWRIVLHPDDYATALAARERAPLHGTPAVGTYRLRRQDGTFRWVEERVVRQQDDGETVLVASCNDVTEQHEIRERLVETNALTQGILNSALDAIITMDENNRIVGFNPAAERLFGYDAEAMMGEDVRKLMPMRFREGHTTRSREFAQRKGPARRLGGAASGVMGLRADGTEFPMEATVSQVLTPKGRLITAIIRDITAQVFAVREIQDREQRLRLALDSANLGSAEIDLSTGRLLATEAAARMFGLGDDPAGWVVPEFQKLIHPLDRAYVLGVIDAIVREDRPLDAEFRAVRPNDGTERWLYGRGRLYRDARGQPQRVVGVVMDIQSRKQNEAQLRQLSQRVLAVQEDERRRIARELHDQIGQALTAALINLQILSPGVPDGPAQELQTTLTSVLSQVRELSLNLRPSMLDSIGLEPALRWYLDRQAALGRFRVELECAQEPRLPPETETLVFRLVQEAVTNILRHARARTVWVRVESSADEVALIVRDDGVGFDPKEVMARAAAGNSIGVLGMAERVELAGGVLTFDSAPGVGATVTVLLPLRK